MEIFMRNIIHISFGEDICKEPIAILCMSDESGDKPMVERTIGFGPALMESNRQINRVFLKRANPVYKTITELTGTCPSLTAFDREFDETCARLRKFILNYVQ